MHESVTLDQAIAYLNELVALDAYAVSELLETRVACNAALAEHPTAQVMEWEGTYRIGLMGVLNGLFGVNEHDWGPITFSWQAGKVLRFMRTGSVPVEVFTQPHEVDEQGRRPLAERPKEG